MALMSAEDYSFTFRLSGESMLLARQLSVAEVSMGEPAAALNIGLCSKLGKDMLLGFVPWGLFVETHGALRLIAIGMKSTSGMGRSLEISAAAGCLTSPQAFFDGLLAFCETQCVSHLLVEEVELDGGSISIPKLAGEFERYSGVKLYVWDLASEAWNEGISSNHRRNIAKARRLGVQFETAIGSDRLHAHKVLVGTSLRRRSERGEPTHLAAHEGEFEEVLSTGCAQLFQAELDGQVVSSKLVFVVGQYAFYDSGGTSQQGMSIGASHLLMYEVARSLRERGVRSLNLDVASAAAGGLGRFKADFGAREVVVERVRCNINSPRKLLMNAWSELVSHFSDTRR